MPFTPARLAITIASSLAFLSVFSCTDDEHGSRKTGADASAPEAEALVEAGVLPSKLTRASRGSAIDISEDDALLITVNRDGGTVSVFDVLPTGALTKKAEISTCVEPWQVVLAPSGDRAFVVCRKDQKVVRIDHLRGVPVKGPELPVGSEPTGIALTPKGTSAWVANWMDGTASEIDTEKMTLQGSVDLNVALVASGALGAVTPRAALAHPRSIAITNNRDDLESDESIFVTEFFAQQREALAADGSNADVAKQGLVYRINARDKTVNTIALPPISDIGIHNHNDSVAGCYPNQLQAIGIQGSFAYVASICASPKGPLGDFTGPAFAACTDDAACPGGGAGSCNLVTSLCKTNCTTSTECGLGGTCATNACKANYWNARTVFTPAISVIDIGGNKVIASVPLNGEIDKLFADKGVADTSARRYPLSITDIAFVPGTLNAYLPSRGADAVFRVDFNATYDTKAVDAMGFADKQFIKLDLGTIDASKQGKLPIGVAIAHRAKVGSPERFAFVLNEATRNVTVLDLSVDDIAGLPDQAVVASATAMPKPGTKEEMVLEGKRLFATGLGRWSLNGQAWGACESCHWDGLSDQVTWFHLRGDRQSPSLDQTIDKKTGKARAQGWQANVDELEDHEAGALRTVVGGVGALVKNLDLTNDARIPFNVYGHAGLNGSMAAAANPTSAAAVVGEVCVVDDWKKIIAYEGSLRTPRRPSNLDAAKVALGRSTFEQAKCQGCHAGGTWTLSNVFYSPDPNIAPATNTNALLIARSWATATTLAGFPTELLPTAVAANQTMRYSGTNAAALDQLTCLLRAVGTYNVAEPGVGIAERRRGMGPTPAAQGDEPTGRGYNVPSLLGMGVNAPFFHGGNARTLEALLSEPFSAHHAALSAGFLASDDPTAAERRASLVQFLLSIDEDTTTIPLSPLGPNGGDFCAAP